MDLVPTTPQSKLAEEIVGSVAAFSILFVELPICCYWIYKLYQNRTEMFISKRYPKITICFTASILFYMICLGLWNISFALHSLILWLTVSSLITIALWVFLYSLLCKSWITYFNYKWSFYTLELQWKLIINSKQTNNWYLLHKKTYGNVRWVTKMLAIVFIVNFVLTLFAAQLAFMSNPILATIGILIVMIILSISVIAYIIIICKTPNSEKFNDLFFIHWESKLIAKILGIFCILFFAVWCVNSALIVLWKDAALTSFIIGTIPISFVFVTIIYVSTVLVIKKNVLQNQTFEEMSMTSTVHSAKSKTSQTFAKIVRVLADNDALHIFMTHLSTEYSMEILLSYIEFGQYLKHLESEGVTFEKNEMRVQLPDNLPQSQIVMNDNTDFKKKACELFHKYIKRGSAYEVNIAGSLRSAFTDLINNYMNSKDFEVKPEDIKTLCVESNKQMLKLLTYSYARFKANDSDDFHKVQGLISVSHS